MIKFVVPFQFFLSSLKGLGTKKHNKFIKMAEDREVKIVILGLFFNF